MIKIKKVIVIGGGPSGMMAAINASNNYDVLLLERNEKLGKKLSITGKGRCNITSSKDISEFFDYIPTNHDFLYSALYSFTNTDTIKFFEKLGVPLKSERGDRVFPKSDNAHDIIDALYKELKRKNVKIKYNSRVAKLLKKDNQIVKLVLNDGTEIEGDYYILSTGGKSYPQTGSTGDGYKLASECGHTIVEPKPALVPIETNENCIGELQGLSLKNVELNIIDKNNNVIYSEFGEMIFTHFGISGPIVLSASRVVNNRKNLKASINLKPALTPEELDKRIQRDFLKYSNKEFKNSLKDLLPQRLIDVIIKLSGIDEYKKVNSITKEERKRLGSIIQNFTLNIKGLRPIEEAIITSGGIDVKEINPSTMNSKIIKNLYFCGEIMDVDAYTGGFNLQIALSTGYIAGSNIAKYDV